MAPLRSSSGRSFGKLLGVNRSNDLANDTNSGASQRGQLNSRYVGARAQALEFISPLVATGGTKITTPDYVYHVFEYDANPQSFVVQAATEGEITYLVVGGGGGGSNQHSGGAGAGGLRTNDPNSAPGGPGTSSEGDYTCTAGTYTVIVGAGGPGAGPGPPPNIRAAVCGPQAPALYRAVPILLTSVQEEPSYSSTRATVSGEETPSLPPATTAAVVVPEP